MINQDVEWLRSLIASLTGQKTCGEAWDTRSDALGADGAFAVYSPDPGARGFFIVTPGGVWPLFSVTLTPVGIDANFPASIANTCTFFRCRLAPRNRIEYLKSTRDIAYRLTRSTGRIARSPTIPSFEVRLPCPSPATSRTRQSRSKPRPSSTCVRVLAARRERKTPPSR